MARIARRQPTLTSPPLSSHALSASRSSASRSGLTGAQSPAPALSRDSSLSGSKRVRRLPISTTQPAPRSRRPAAGPIPKRWQGVPSASKETLGVRSRDVGVDHRLLPGLVGDPPGAEAGRALRLLLRALDDDDLHDRRPRRGPRG